jgi:hypothetical protein
MNVGLLKPLSDIFSKYFRLSRIWWKCISMDLCFYRKTFLQFRWIG